ncbi:acetyltransferase [Alphaproteobacteria bacterium]|nr:acetyltransferase [Alphaproteobacteria bacterium]
MKKLVIYGTGQIAEIAHYYFSLYSNFEVVAFTDNEKYLTDTKFLDLQVVKFENIENLYSPKNFYMFVAVSYKGLNSLRKKMYLAAKNKGYRLASFIFPDSHLINNIEIGENCLILENQTLQPFSKIGDNVFVWGNCVLGHHTKILDHCWLTSGTSIGGNSIINEKTFLGLNSTIGHFVEIGRENFIGANVLVTKNTQPKSVYIQKDTEKFKLDSDKFLIISKMI